MATDGLANPNASKLDIAAYSLLGAAVLPLAALESIPTGLYNAPNDFYRAGQRSQRAFGTNDADDRVLNTLGAVRETTNGILGVLGPLAASTSVLRGSSQPASERAIARATYTIKNGTPDVIASYSTSHAEVIATGANSTLGLTELNPALIRTTQTTVKQQGATIPKLVESMQRDGFVVEPDRLIDVVRMPDGELTSLDNTRILAAQRAGVNIQARVFDHADLLPNDLDYISRFIGRKGEIPTTFGDAVRNRISNQSAAYRNIYPNGSPYIGSGH